MIPADDPRHGKRAGYLRGCRCTPCSDAHYRYMKRYRADREQAPTRDVPTGPVLEHMRRLNDSGLSNATIARLAGVPRTTVQQIENRAKMRPTTAAAILAIRPTRDVANEAQYVNATPTARRIQALAALGYSRLKVAQGAGLCERVVTNVASGALTKVRGTTATAIAALYETWSMRLPTAHTKADRVGITRARNLARSRGWVPPLAWDDIDDITATPHIGTDKRTPADLDEFMHLIRGSEHPTRAAHRLGVTVSAIEENARRHNRPDVLEVTRGARNQERNAA